MTNGAACGNITINATSCPAGTTWVAQPCGVVLGPDGQTIGSCAANSGIPAGPTVGGVTGGSLAFLDPLINFMQTNGGLGLWGIGGALLLVWLLVKE